VKTSLTVDDVLHDIEIELLQSAVTHNELGRSVEAVRSYQNRLRTELLDQGRLPGDVRAVAAAQFELTDMVLTLLAETAIRLQAVQWDQQRLLRRLVPMPQDSTEPQPGSRQPVAAAEQEAAKSESLRPDECGLPGEEDTDCGASATLSAMEDEWARRAAALETLLAEEHLRVQVDVQPSETPVVGAALGTLKTALHSLVVFYVNRFAARQGAVNQALGAWVLELQGTARRQQDEIDLLRGEVRRIQAQLRQYPAPATPEQQDS
jgi:hypothetical protein